MRTRRARRGTKRGAPPKPPVRARSSYGSGLSQSLIANMPPAPPERRIVSSTVPARQPGRMGILAMSTLECGHQVETGAGDRRRGWCHCFECADRSPPARRFPGPKAEST